MVLRRNLCSSTIHLKKYLYKKINYLNMINDFGFLLQKTPIEVIQLIGLLVVFILISLIYYLSLVFIILFFFNPTVKAAFFSVHERASKITSFFFWIFVAVGSLYSMLIFGNIQPNVSYFSIIYFSLVTSLIITVIVQETGKKLWSQNSAFYDAIISFVAILIFISPTQKAFVLGELEGLFWSLGMIFALPILLIIIKKIDLIKNIIKLLYGATK